RLAYAKATAKRQKANNLIKDLRKKLQSKPKNAEELREKLKKATETIKSSEKKGIKWATELNSDGALLLTDNLALVGGKERVDALDLETGKILWTDKVEGNVRGLVAANGHLIVSTTTGHIYTYATEKRDIPAPESIVNNPYPDDELTEVYAKAA